MTARQATYYHVLPMGKSSALPQAVTWQKETGRCRGRMARGRSMRPTTAGSPLVDPIEKPFYHLYPGTKILSVGTVGCNLHCQFCQNWQIAQAVRNRGAFPGRAVDLAVRLQAKGNIGSYTY